MRGKAKELYESGFGSLKKIAEELNISENTVKSWKSRDKWVQPTSKKGAPKTKKVAPQKIKEVAKALIEEGHTLKEVSEQTGTPRSTIANWSAKENLQQSQLEYLKQFREKYKEKVEKNKLKRLEINEVALKAIVSEIRGWEMTESISKSSLEKLMLNEQVERLILDIDRIDKLERFELDKETKQLQNQKLAKELNPDDEKTEEKTITAVRKKYGL
ncbi:phage terminase small subunit-related protein [Cetobacterium somerae]|uniref:terminase gpP N-terminus-related DNA-binding protein n=1 Tax=Cetobacterium somerae TaxID=188913 RepID=UPI002E7BC2CA|nr:phage terminase small subunit-related protein [Cetobacterium somerae]WVJ02043.1 phage terminase small subunit-related protein [Cetobacterium somerae]